MLPVGIGIQSGIDEVKELEAKETRRKPGNSNVRNERNLHVVYLKFMMNFE